MNTADQKKLETLERLRAALLKTKNWPIKYMFKFIAPNKPLVLKELMSVIPEPDKTLLRASRDLHYMSVTYVSLMYSADEIIDLTQRATSIEGVISL